MILIKIVNGIRKVKIKNAPFDEILAHLVMVVLEVIFTYVKNESTYENVKNEFCKAIKAVTYDAMKVELANGKERIGYNE